MGRWQSAGWRYPGAPGLWFGDDRCPVRQPHELHDKLAFDWVSSPTPFATSIATFTPTFSSTSASSKVHNIEKTTFEVVRWWWILSRFDLLCSYINQYTGQLMSWKFPLETWTPAALLVRVSLMFHHYNDCDSQTAIHHVILSRTSCPLLPRYF